MVIVLIVLALVEMVGLAVISSIAHDIKEDAVHLAETVRDRDSEIETLRNRLNQMTIELEEDEEALDRMLREKCPSLSRPVESETW